MPVFYHQTRASEFRVIVTVGEVVAAETPPPSLVTDCSVRYQQSEHMLDICKQLGGLQEIACSSHTWISVSVPQTS
jgi:hypothetical protein